MNRPAFWLRRALLLWLLAAAIIAASHLLRQRSWRHALEQGVLWGALAAAIVFATRYRRAARGEACALCRDTPQSVDEPRHSGQDENR